MLYVFNEIDKIIATKEFQELKERSIVAYEEFSKISQELEEKFPIEGRFWGYYSNGIPMSYSKGSLIND